jgi:surfeit locus 1 family protein
MRRLVFPLVLGLGGAAILVSLGLWQLDRLDQKEAYIAAIEAQLGAAPGPLPAAPDRVSDRMLPVAVAGEYLNGDILILASPRGMGPGYRVVAPFQTAEGRKILVDRGFVSEGAHGLPRPGGAAQIVGNLDWPNETDSFTPEPDAARGIWFARDVDALAATLGTEPVLLVLRETSQHDTPVAPLPLDSAGIPNDHLEYAVTWFGLALVWLAMTVILVRRTRSRSP